jgi:NADH dehydrogenase/NADH:ubiquinone oxidoreductase subunit G
MFRRLSNEALTIRLMVDGSPIAAARGDTVAAALLAAGINKFCRSPLSHSARAPFCGMGVCFDCRVTIDGEANRQACLTPVQNGMTISTGSGRRQLLLETAP